MAFNLNWWTTKLSFAMVGNWFEDYQTSWEVIIINPSIGTLIYFQSTKLIATSLNCFFIDIVYCGSRFSLYCRYFIAFLNSSCTNRSNWRQLARIKSEDKKSIKRKEESSSKVKVTSIAKFSESKRNNMVKKFKDGYKVFYFYFFPFSRSLCYCWYVGLYVISRIIGTLETLANAC